MFLSSIVIVFDSNTYIYTIICFKCHQNEIPQPNYYKTCILSREIGNPSNQDNSGWLREHFDKKKDSQEIFSSLRVKRSLNSSWPIWALGVWVEGKGEEKVWFRARRPQQQSNYTMMHFETFLSDEWLVEITLRLISIDDNNNRSETLIASILYHITKS